MLSEEDASLDLCLKQWADEATGELRSVLLFASARIRTLSAQLAEAEKYNGWHQEALLVRDAALERAEKAEGECDKLLREHNRLRRQWERQMIKRIEKLRTAALAILSAKEKVNQ